MKCNKKLYGWACFFGGAALGYSVGLLISTDQRKMQKQKINSLLDGVDWDILSQSIFGVSNQEAVEKVKDVVEDFQSKFDNLTDKLRGSQKSKYENLVDDFTERLTSDKAFTGDQIERLGQYLKSDYKKLIEES